MRGRGHFALLHECLVPDDFAKYSATQHFVFVRKRRKEKGEKERENGTLLSWPNANRQQQNKENGEEEEENFNFVLALFCTTHTTKHTNYCEKMWVEEGNAILLLNNYETKRTDKQWMKKAAAKNSEKNKTKVQPRALTPLP